MHEVWGDRYVVLHRSSASTPDSNIKGAVATGIQQPHVGAVLQKSGDHFHMAVLSSKVQWCRGEGQSVFPIGVQLVHFQEVQHLFGLPSFRCTVKWVLKRQGEKNRRASDRLVNHRDEEGKGREGTACRTEPITFAGSRR